MSIDTNKKIAKFVLVHVQTVNYNQKATVKAE